MDEDNDFPTFADGDVLMHLRFLPGFEPETVSLGNTEYQLMVMQDEDEMIHVVVHK